MHVAGDGFGLDHLLAVEAHGDAQRAVRRRVLRADVEGHVAGLQLDVDPGIGGLAGDVGELLAIADGGHLYASPACSAASMTAASSVASRCSGIGSTSTTPGHGFTTRASSG